MLPQRQQPLRRVGDQRRPAGVELVPAESLSSTDTIGSFIIRCDLPPTWMGNMSLWYIDDVRID